MMFDHVKKKKLDSPKIFFGSTRNYNSVFIKKHNKIFLATHPHLISIVLIPSDSYNYLPRRIIIIVDNNNNTFTLCDLLHLR